jgi:hypothetical protein
MRRLAWGMLLLCSACNHDQQSWDGEVTTTVDHSFVDSEFHAIRHLIDLEGMADTAIYGGVSGTQRIFCPSTVASVQRTGPGTIRLTVDFGSGANCIDGRLRAGRLIANFTGKWKDPGSTVVISPQGYTVAGYAFSFTLSVTVNPRDADNHRNWRTVVNDAVLVHPGSGTITWSGTHTTAWVEGEGRPDPGTYAYAVTGAANGIARNSLSFTAQVDHPLRVHTVCPYPVSGIWGITPQGLLRRSLDYGGGGCDLQATMTVGDYSLQVVLP